MAGNNGPKHLTNRSLAVIIDKPSQVETGVAVRHCGNTMIPLGIKGTSPVFISWSKTIIIAAGNLVDQPTTNRNHNR